MKKSILLFLSSVMPMTVVMGQTLTYQLLPSSTITPATEGIPSGPSQPLTGFFTWVPHTPSDVEDSDTFNITSLNFTSSTYSLTLANGSQPDNTTQIGPNGQTGLNAEVNLAGSLQNPWFLGAYGNGSFSGPATAPTRITFNAEGFYSSVSGFNEANLIIDARLIPDQVTNTLKITATILLQAGTNDNGKAVTTAAPAKLAFDTKQILVFLARDEFAEGNYGATEFPTNATLVAAISGPETGDKGIFQVLDENGALLVDVSDILSLQQGTNVVVSGKMDDNNSLGDRSVTQQYILAFNYDDSAIKDGVRLKFCLQGLTTRKVADTTNKAGVLTETISSKMAGAMGDGNYRGDPFVINGSLTGGGKIRLQ